MTGPIWVSVCDPLCHLFVAFDMRDTEELGLRGLKLSPPTQEFYPHDKSLAYPIYEGAQHWGIPVLFHGGMSWEPQAKAKYGQPLHLEDVASDFPKPKDSYHPLRLALGAEGSHAGSQISKCIYRYLLSLFR